MAKHNASKSRTAAATTTDRRTRLRLRDLCDEVLASWRLAADRDLFSADDRAAAQQLIPVRAR